MTVRAIEWPMRPLGELVDILDSRRVPVSAKERSNRPGEVPYYGASGPVGTIDKHIFDEPLVLLGEDGVQFFDSGKSKSYLIEGPAWVNNHAHVLRARPMVERKFLNYYLNYCDYRGFANGTTRLKLTQSAMRQIPVPVPPITEQRSIIDLLEDHLSRLDAADSYLTTAGAREAVLHGQLLAAALAGVEGDEARLSDLLAVGLANGRSVPTQHDGFPVLRLTALRNGRIDLGERKGGAWTQGDAARFLVERDDFLISRGNGSLRLVGLGGLVMDDPDPVAYPDTVIRARPNVERLSAVYLAMVWNSPLVRRQIEAIARTTAGIYKVNQRDLGSIAFPVPSLADQAVVVQKVQESRDSLATVASERKRAITRSRSLRRALLTAAFSGRLTGDLPTKELE